MIPLRFTVSYVNGSIIEVETNLRDEVAFERHFAVPVTDILPKGIMAKALELGRQMTMADVDAADVAIKVEWIYFLAWHPLYRKGVEPDFDEFLDKLADIKLAYLPSGPTPPAR